MFHYIFYSGFLPVFSDPSLTTFTDLTGQRFFVDTTLTVSFSTTISNQAVAGAGNDIAASGSGDNYLLSLELSDEVNLLCKINSLSRS